MPAVAPATDRLSPWRAPLRAAVGDALAAVLALPEVADAPWELDGEGVSVALAGATLRVRGLDAAARADQPLRIRVEGPGRSGLLERLRVDRAALPTLATAWDAWRPFADLPDEEFRKVSSSPAGTYGTLRLGYRCNQDCWFCWQDRKAPAPPPERWLGWLDELAAMGITAVNLTGGEATTFRQLPALIARAAQVHGMDVSLQTNAVRLGRPGYAERLADAGLKAAMISLHSADPAISDAMTRAPGTHARTLRGIDAALAVGLHVTLTCVVEAANVDGLPELAALVADRFAGPDRAVARVTFAHPTEYFEAGRWAAQQVPLDRLRGPLSAAVARLRQAGVAVQIGGPCGFPACALDPAVVADPYQVVARSTFSPEELQHRRFAAVCAGCDRRPRCFGLRQEYLDRFGDRGLVPA